MTITRKRIINPQRYLYALHHGDKFYIAVPLESEDYPRLQSYGILSDSLARIPIPKRAATRMNANGRWKILKDLPKEERFFEHDYHVVDWHGTDHYELAGKAVCVISGNWFHLLNLRSLSKIKFSIPRFL